MDLFRVYDGTRYLTLFGSERYDAIYGIIRYLISLKNSITYIFSHYLRKSKLILMIRRGVLVITAAQLHSAKSERRFKSCTLRVGDSR